MKRKTIFLSFILMFFFFVISACSTTTISQQQEGIKVSFVDESNFNIYPSIYLQESSTIERPEDPTKRGHTFLYWTFNDQMWDFNNTINEDIVLKATWEKNTYRINLDPDEGILEEEYIEVTYNEPYTLPIPTKEGYDFIGWFKNDVKQNDNLFLVDYDIDLTAKWAAKSFTITYDPQEGEVDVLTQKAFYNYTYSLEVPTRKGYDFIGWYDKDDNLFEEDVWHLLEDVELKAKWQAKKYNLLLKFQYENGTQALEDDLKVLNFKDHYSFEVPTIEGYKANYQIIDGTMLDEDKTIIITYGMPHKVEVSFMLQNGNVASPTIEREYIKGEEILIPIPVIEGFSTKSGYVKGKMGDSDLSYTVMYYYGWDGKGIVRFSSGTGQAYDPYIISTPEQLAYLANQVNRGTTYKDLYISLSNDIYLGNQEWSPIGGLNNTSFQGHFLGNGYTISSFKITSLENSLFRFNNYYYNQAGLFGIIEENGSISNLTVSNYTINLASDSSIITSRNHEFMIGGLVGNLKDKASIINCASIEGTIITSSFGASSIGGLVGKMEATEIRNSYADNNIEASKNAIYSLKVGGLVGQILSGNIYNCYTLGSVKALNSANGNTYLGGLIGEINRSKIYYSYSNASVYGKSNNSNEYITYAGGLIGKTAKYVGGVYQSIFLGNVEVETNSNGSINTIVGEGRSLDNYYIEEVKITLNSSVIENSQSSLITLTDIEKGNYVFSTFKDLEDLENYPNNVWVLKDNNLPTFYWQ